MQDVLGELFKVNQRFDEIKRVMELRFEECMGEMSELRRIMRKRNHSKYKVC